jgi:hypothetical protein
VSDTSAALKSRTIEIVCGLAMVIVGVGVTAAASSGNSANPLGIGAGGVLTALGGVLLSWVAAVAFSKSEATRELNEQLDAVSRNLGHAATRVNRAVEQCQAQELDPMASLALISQANTMIYGQIDQIQRLIGAKFNSDELAQTLGELDKLAVKLDRHPSATSADVREEVARILAKARGAGGTQDRRVVEVQCPHCGVHSPAPLGVESGATAEVSCPSCTRRFNAHRAGDGSVFTRPKSKAVVATVAAANQTSVVGSEPFTFDCTECGTPITLRAGIPDDKPRLMMCTACCRSHMVTAKSRRVAAGDKYTLTSGAGRIVGRSGAQPYVPCPKCGRVVRAALNNGSSRFAVCSTDLQVIEVSHEEFTRWRADNSDAGGV